MATNGFKPQPPVVRFSEDGKWLYAHLMVHVGPGQVIGFRSRTDLSEIERQMRDGAEVGGFFGSIFKGISKAVKTVGKATGLNKVVGVAMKVLDNPILKTVFPVAGLASAGLHVAKNLITAQAAKAAGKPELASKALAYSAAIADKAGLDKLGAARQAEKTFHLIISPR